jgi:hypothetical protein
MQLKGRGTVNRTKTPYTLAAARYPRVLGEYAAYTGAISAAVIASRNSRFTFATNARHDQVPQQDPASHQVLQYRRTFRHARPSEVTSLGPWGEHGNCVLRRGAELTLMFLVTLRLSGDGNCLFSFTIFPVTEFVE